jgi:site-specific DNA recombinase
METAMKSAAIYARVSSDKQKEENTIASQTSALVEFARKNGYAVPDEWVFEDEGFSGASLVRPGLEHLRDLAAEGHIAAVLVHAPDRLSRKYAYQVLLVEEFARNGVETIFVKAPKSDSPEDQLLLQFQGMIAEYERAQILERSRRGKRYRARQGQVSVLSGAPYGYRAECNRLYEGHIPDRMGSRVNTRLSAPHNNMLSVRHSSSNR